MEFERLSNLNFKYVSEWISDKSIRKWIYIDDWKEYISFTQKNENFTNFILKCQNNTIGLLITERIGFDSHIALIINPKFQNQGFGIKVLKAFNNRYNMLLSYAPRRFIANISKGNLKSIKCFERAGFVLNKNNAEEIEYVFKLDAEVKV